MLRAKPESENPKHSACSLSAAPTLRLGIGTSERQQQQQQKHANAQSPRAGSRHVGSARNQTRRACTAVSTKDSGGSGSTRSDRIAAISSHGASDCHRGQEQVWTTLQLNSSFEKKKEEKEIGAILQKKVDNAGWTPPVDTLPLT
ncbi:hypothetical protein F2P81_015733 [Scophthalmus maximus]|uniref:Uncharacterized protein n=1 Tax=Scophthalmus maximus TaxID=52904 RepID=A0A6A4SG22_SCOMX|nr:hypothetical protein F2P81_015733 [Scophthalmus maximus]